MIPYTVFPCAKQGAIRATVGGLVTARSMPSTGEGAWRGFHPDSDFGRITSPQEARADEDPERRFEFIPLWGLRLRAATWRRYKNPAPPSGLYDLGYDRGQQATPLAGFAPWYLAKAKALYIGLSNAYFKSLGLPSYLTG